MKITLLTATLALLMSTVSLAQTYQDMMNDYRYNFYEVVDSAEKYFDEQGQVSGWKTYQRWKYRQEGHFFPSGDRSKISPHFVSKGYHKFQSEFPASASRSSQNNTWKDLGPYDANNISLHYAAGIGRVECFYVDPKNDQRIYIGSRSGGFWRTTDGGTNWQNTTDTLPASGVDVICVSPTNPDSVWINVRNADNGYSHGVYLSADGGMTWNTTWFNPSNSFGGFQESDRVSTIVFSPHSANLMFVATSGGLYRSTDRMQTRTQITTRFVNRLAFHPTDDQIVYAYGGLGFNLSSYNRVYRSLDGGQNFNRSTTLLNKGQRDVALVTRPQCPDCVWFASHSGMWKSEDAGVSYTFIGKPSYYEGGGGFAVSDVDTSKIIYGFEDLFRSSDGGRTLTQATYWNTGSPGSNRQTNYIHADARVADCINGVFYVGSDGYLAKSADNGKTWTRISDGTGIRENYRAGVSQSQADYTVCGSQDNGTSVRTDTGWVEWYGGDGMECFVHPLNADWVMGSVQNGRRYWAKDGGWSYENGYHPGTMDWVAPLLFDPNDPFTVYSIGYDVYKTTEFGTNWQIISKSAVGTPKLAAIASNNTQILAFVRNDELAISMDGGKTMTDVSNNVPTFYSISAITFHPDRDSTLFIAYDRHDDNNRRVYMSTDLGQTWQNISYNLSPIPVSSLIIDHSPENYIYAGGEIGVYYKAMKDTVWQLLGEGLPSVTVRDLEIQYGSNTLRAATWGRGLWEASLVNRVDYPKILTVIPTEKPTDLQPVEGLPMDVESMISYSGNLSKVYLKWSKDSTQLDKTISFTLQQDSTWKSDQAIPGYPEGTRIFFKVYAIGDHNDTTETYRYTYAFRECTSKPTVSAQVNKTQICEGESVIFTGSGALSYTWDSGVQDGVPFFPTETQTYTVTGRDVNQCVGSDQVTVQVKKIDVSLTEQSGTMEVAEASAQYQWLNCDQQWAPISGATSKQYTPTQGGSYAVEVTAGNCVDTSACKTSFLSIEDQSDAGDLIIYPNPGDGLYTLVFSAPKSEISLTLLDVSGKVVAEHKTGGVDRLEWNVQHLANGTYTLKVLSDGELKTLRLIKE
ncbi:T9SS type A sorting domain-containing protein [bacterium SCSIO 12741]|nr:T9SS type A sorting domain-containing protein [bacterium SCSIO 12741]